MAFTPESLAHRNRLIAKIMAQYAEDQQVNVLPVVSLEDFFKHNYDDASLAPNIAHAGRPALSECYSILQDIRAQPDVQDVLVAIYETPDADDEGDSDAWPYSETVYILTSAARDEVAAWVATLLPDDIGDTWSCGTGIKPNAAPELLPGVKVHAVWWD